MLERLKSVIVTFLAERGLELSAEKTAITSIHDGFDFLGFNIRKYNQTLLIKPTKASLKKIRATIREVVRQNVSAPTAALIRELNPKLRGWANYYRSAVSSRAFAAIDNEVFLTVWSWAKRRHPHKSSSWIRTRYFRRSGLRRWIFFGVDINQRGIKQVLNIALVNQTRIKRHVKIKSEATPYDPIYTEYFEQRKERTKPRSMGYWSHHMATTCFR